MELERDDGRQPGRWVLTPRKGTRFVGPRQRARQRARERRRRIVIVLLEAIAITAVIAMFPPLRGMFVLTGILMGLLLAYVGLCAYFVGGGRIQEWATRSEAEPSPIKLVSLPQSPIEFAGEPPRVRVAVVR